MPVVELLVSAFLPVLLERLTSPELLRFLHQEGLFSKIKKWKDTLKMIQLVLGDAEEKQFKNSDVEMWLDDLRDLAYDVEDILDEFATEAFERKLKIEQHDQPSSSKIRKFVPSCFRNLSPRAIKFNRGMESQIKDVSSRFEHLCRLRESLGLKENNAGGTSSNAAPRRLRSSSVPTEPAVYGRDGDKKRILEMVLNGEPTDANFRVIPIVGMGGVGKTTLAREVYNDTMVQSFELRAWVCVSDDYDVLRVSNAILEYISGSPSELKELSTAQNILKEKVNGRKFLLVLDDVWRMDYGEWESLKSPFMAGARGSRMIVTTRIGGVASTIRPSGFYKLNKLSDEDCWPVFSMHAFEDGEIPVHAHGNIELIRQKVIERSKGLPLAARSLGGLLRSKKEDEWLVILNSGIWDLSKEGENEVPAALKLSYHHLPSHLKRCFAFCAIFPKDYEYEEEELVLLWMAEGLIQQSTKNKQLEDYGGEYFHELLSRSIFQQSSSNRSKFTMHDLVHDLAQWAFGELILRVEDVIGDVKKPRVLDKVRYFSYTADRFEGKKKFEDLDEVESLRSRIRTFLPIFRYDYMQCYITDLIISDLVPKLKRLRALSLRKYYITEVPNSIGGLRHLRYLNLSGTQIISLPESTSLLHNLQILMLRDCSRLGKLPCKFRYLIKLRHLDIKGAISIKEMPSGMKELESLQKLSNFIVGKDVGSNLEDLKSLKMLRGELCISGLDNVVNCEARDLILRDKDLKELLLEWGSQFDDSRNQVVEKEVLEMLQPSQHLEKLTIRCYGGTRFPSWVGDSSFSKVTVLRLQSCEKCISLPSLGLLGMLKDLTIKGMKGLKHLGSEIYGEGCKKPFQLLETLCFEDMPQWENWEPVKENEYVDAFPCLRELTVVNCPKLSRSLPDWLPSLEKLVIKNCKLLVVSFSSLPLLCKLEIDGCKGLACNSPTDSKSLKSMTLADIPEFGNWLRPPQGLLSFISITELRIENCSNLISFPEVCFLINLISLEIINCDALTSLPKGMNDKNASLGSLKMKDCNSLTFIVRGKLPSSLKKLEIENCEKLESLWDDNEESCTSVVDEENNNNTSTSHLEYLHVRACPSLKCLSSSGRLPETLRILSLHSLRELESIAKTFLNSWSLEEITVKSCENLKSIPKGLHNLIHLRKIELYDCRSIDCLAEEGPPNTNLSELTIKYCKKLKALPNWFHNSLKSLTLDVCLSMTSFPEEGFPTNLTSLTFFVLNVTMYKAVLEWGLHNLISLTSLSIRGLRQAESFPQQEMEMTFPPSLTHLAIHDFPDLKCLMGEGFRNLNSLEYLFISGCPNLTSFPELALSSSLKSLAIHDCPNLKSFPDLALPSSLKRMHIQRCPNLKSFSKLCHLSSLSNLLIRQCPEVRSFPEQGLPSSLLQLQILACPKLKEECKRDKGREWPKISHIPHVDMRW